jgi:glycosyltransferase involved in cell wall biosynthesis
VTQIYNGVDTDRFRPGPEREATRARLGLASDALVVGHVGRLVAVKDHPTLFRAFDEVRRRVPQAVLVCVGDGPLEAELRARAGPGVRLVGHHADVADVLRAFDVFALPSRNEGISNTILEAMATGLPVVATAVGGNPELVTDGVTGALVPGGDVQALAAAVERYLTDSGRRRHHGLLARDTARERFGMEPMVRAYEAVWRRVASAAFAR